MMSPKQAHRSAVRAVKRNMRNDTTTTFIAAQRAIERFFSLTEADELRVTHCIPFRGHMFCLTASFERPLGLL